MRNRAVIASFVPDFDLDLSGRSVDTPYAQPRIMELPKEFLETNI